MQYLPLLFSAIFLALVAQLTVGAWRGQGASASHDRWKLITSLVSAVAICAFATLLINWTSVPIIVWFAGIALLASGVAGTALRWPDLPWFADGDARPRRVAGIAADLLVSAIMIGVVIA